MSHLEIFRAEHLPILQNRTYATELDALTCPKGDVVLVQDLKTGLVSNAAFDPDLLVYDADYQNEQAWSGVFQSHLDDVTKVIDRHFKGKTLIEVGCGKGYFLDHLCHQGWLITGIDPAYEGDNPHILKATFNASLSLSSDGLILRHVLEHICDPMGFLSDIAGANGGKGTIYIEVPCFDWICRNRAWFDVFYEHVNYFRLADFERMFGRVHEAGHLFGGQYLYVVAELSTLHPPHTTENDFIDFPPDFLAGIEQCVKLLGTQNTEHRTQNTEHSGLFGAVLPKA